MDRSGGWGGINTAGTCPAPLHDELEEGDHLHGLAQPHLVAQDAGLPDDPRVGQPQEALHLATAI